MDYSEMSSFIRVIKVYNKCDLPIVCLRLYVFICLLVFVYVGVSMSVHLFVRHCAMIFFFISTYDGSMEEKRAKENEIVMVLFLYC